MPIQNVPAHIAARIAARKGSDNRSSVASSILGDSGLFQYPRISIRAGRYRLVEDGVETPVGVSLDVIIVGSNPRTSKVFYSKQYDPNADNTRPDCFSNDGIKPDPIVAQPVNPDCASCPNNVLGSKILPSGAKSKLCADQRHLAVIPAADPNKVYGLTIPVSAMKGLRDYIKDLNNAGVNPEEAITELGFDEQASYPKITFTHKGYVPEKSLADVEKLLNSSDVQIVTRSGITSDMAKLAAPASTSALPAPVAAPAAPAAPVVVPPVQAAAEKPVLPSVSEQVAAGVRPVVTAPRTRRNGAPVATAPVPVQPSPPQPIVPTPAPAATPTATASSELAKKLDSIFG